MSNPQWIIPVDSIPENQSTHIYILENTDILKQIEKFKKMSFPHYIELPFEFDHAQLKTDTFSAIDEIGLFPFSYAGEEAVKDVYMSASLTWNPHARDNVSENPHQATLGSTSHKYGSASLYGLEKSDKNSYTDGMSFNRPTPLAQYKKIGELTSSFTRTMVRSRISSLKAGKIEATKFNFGWHNDELIYVNLRINIPVASSPNYAIQLITDESEDTFKIQEFELKERHAYVYDTSKNHRPFCKKLSEEDRINMIFGVSPWFDYDPQNRVWRSNEYYGKIHPFEMFQTGLISKLFNCK